MQELFDLKGRRILVTGASSGIGRETAYVVCFWFEKLWGL